MLQPNELMTWEEMKKRYLDRWVFVEVTKGNNINIREGYVRFVTTDEEMPKVWIQCNDNNLDYARDRTTVEQFWGLVGSSDIDIF